MAAALAPDKILKELSELWVELAKEGKGESGAGVLRACSMTLVVLAEMADDPMALGETIAALMPEHPARAILVRLQGAGEPALASRVYSQCWMPFGERRQICCEQIEVTASDAALADLAPVMLAVAAPDLPLILWCRSGRLLRTAEFWNIARMARKVVVDSVQLGAALENPGEALRRLANALRSGFLLGDLSWARLTRWRETLAQVFANRAYLDLLPRVSSVKVRFAAGQEIPAHYMGAWLQAAFALGGARPSFAREQGESFQVRFAGENLQLEQACRDGSLRVTVNGLSQCTNLPQPTDYLMVREELGILRHDRVFEAALAAAARLAYPNGK